MSYKALSIGTHVEIIGKNNTMPYVTTVASVFDDGRVLLDIMRVGGEEKRLVPNIEYTLRFFTERGVFRYPTLLRGYAKKGDFDFMLFQITGTAEKIQRRQQYRLACGVETDFFVMNGEKEDAIKYTGFVRDISSGGVRILTKDELDTKKLIQIKLSFIKPGFALFGTVLSTKVIREAKYLWQYGVEFVGASEVDTERIVLYVHKEQQKARARVM